MSKKIDALKKAMKIIKLRHEARRLYMSIRGRSDMSCGAHLQDFIRPDIREKELAFDRIMDELATLDPEAAKLQAKVGRLADGHR
jgi:hypothetical protein